MALVGINNGTAADGDQEVGTGRAGCGGPGDNTLARAVGADLCEGARVTRAKSAFDALEGPVGELGQRSRRGDEDALCAALIGFRHDRLGSRCSEKHAFDSVDRKRSRRDCLAGFLFHHFL